MRWLFLLARTVSYFGDGVHRIALVWTVYSQTEDAVSLSYVMLASLLPGAILAPFGGLMSDRFNKIKLMVSADLLRGMVVLSILLYLSTSDTIEVSILAGLTAVNSLFGLIFRPSEKGVIKSLVNRNDLISYNGKLMSSQQITAFVGPVLAGVLIPIWGTEVLFAVDAISYFVSALLTMLLLRTTTKIASASARRSKFEFTSLLKDGRIVLIIGTMAACNLLMSGTTAILIPVVSGESFEVGARAFGILESLLALGAFVSGISLGRLARKVKEYDLVFLSLMLIGFGFFLLSYSQLVVTPFLGAFCIGFGTVPVLSTCISMLQNRTSEGNVGKIFSLLGMTMSWSVLASLVLVPYLHEMLGITFSLLACGVFVIAVGIVFRGIGAVLNKNEVPSNAV